MALREKQLLANFRLMQFLMTCSSSLKAVLTRAGLYIEKQGNSLVRVRLLSTMRNEPVSLIKTEECGFIYLHQI